MKAIAFKRYGSPEVLEIVEVEKPTAKAGEVLIKVAFAGLNPMCCKLRSGKFRDSWKLLLPAVMGFEVSGTIAAIGPGVNKFSTDDIGKKVLAFFIKQDGSSGGFAEFVTVPEELIHFCPNDLDLAPAAGLGLAGVTAWQCLVSTAKTTKSDTVLIHSAAGGVGQIGVQVAKLMGNRVIGTASPKNHQLLKDLGCDIVLDYRDNLFLKLGEICPDGIDVARTL